ncbi:unnamed protein product [marine sediment metagenome]|uniref:Uncharacterized protein n=1 Tax=marine sediment metagenome TaxID=412755 RepID=X0ZRE1_9ZZZZ
MKRLHFQQDPNDLGQIHDALLEAGLEPERVEGLGKNIWITIDEADKAAVQEIIEAHVPVPHVDHRIAIIDGMGIAKKDKDALKELFGVVSEPIVEEA